MPTFLSPVGFNSPGATIPAIIGPAGGGTFGVPLAGMQVLVRGPYTDPTQWSALAVVSNDAAAIDKGGAIVLGGGYTGNSVSPWARIGSGKTNNIDGQFGGYLTLATRPNGGSLTERLRITEAGRVGIGADLGSYNGLLTIGGNTTAAVGGAYFGWDTPLWRSGVSVLKTNQLDQTVPPVESFLLHLDTSLSIPSGGSQIPAIGTFTMPFAGDLALAGSGMYYTLTNGTVVVPQTKLVANAGTLDKNPEAWWRSCGVGTAGQEIMTIPMFARYTGLAAGASVTVSVNIANAGAAACGVGKLTCMVTAIRKIGP